MGTPIPLQSEFYSAINSFMSRVISAKNKIGRPKVDSEAVNARMERSQLNALDAWAAKQTDTPSRPEALRRIATDFLKRKGWL